VVLQRFGVIYGRISEILDYKRKNMKYRYAIYSTVLKQYFRNIEEFVNPDVSGETYSFPVFVDKIEMAKLSIWIVSRFWMFILKWGCDKEIKESLVYKRVLPLATKMGVTNKFNFGKKQETLGEIDKKTLGEM
jgi:hypothetical protein